MNTAPVIVVFGITGDLSKRKLLPALYHLMAHDLIYPDTKIIGTSRREIAVDTLLGDVELCVLEKQQTCDPVGIAKMRQALEIMQLDPNSTHDYDALTHYLDRIDANGERDRLFYMAVPPSAYKEIIKQLGEHGLNDARTRLLIEKPFGQDFVSAEALIKSSAQHFDESQLYRIDHYLAKETAQNLLTFRMHNPIFAPLWTGDHIQKIHILASESIGVENRKDFYEQTGALRDLIQGHLLQLLAIVMMDQPIDHSTMTVHEGKQALLNSLAPADPAKAIRGQYDGYKQDVGNPNSFVETYARIELQSDLARWQETEIVLETGKAMQEKVTEIVVQFKHHHERRKNQLRFRLQPDEGISLDLVVKTPGFEERMEHTQLDFSYAKAFGEDAAHPDAYERVIMDAIRADQSLFASSGEVLASWQIVQPLLDAWANNDKDLVPYTIGDQPK